MRGCLSAQTEPLLSIFGTFICVWAEKRPGAAERLAVRPTHLELHGRVLLILWCCVALVVEVVGGGGVDDGRLLRRLVDSLAVDVDQEGEQAGAQEAGNARGNQVDGGERWRGKGDGPLLPPEV